MSNRFNTERVFCVSSLVIMILLLFCLLPGISKGEHAHDFTSKTIEGNDFTLSSLKGNITLLHFMHFCECSKEANDAQLKELVKFSVKENVKERAIIITILYHTPGDPKPEEIVSKYNITWDVIDDTDTFKIFDLYKKYWTDSSGVGFYNPTILLLDKEHNIKGVYHSKLSASALEEKVVKLEKGEFDFEGRIVSEESMYIGMFILGIVTSLSPCSIVLLVSILSYTVTATENKDTKKSDIKKNDTKMVRKGTNGKRANEVNEKSKSRKKRVFERISYSGLVIGIMFTLGMAFVFFLVGLFVSYLSIIISWAAYFYMIAGVILIILGINTFYSLSLLFSSLFEKVWNREKDIDGTSINDNKETIFDKAKAFVMRLTGRFAYLGAFLMGILFSLGWAPCALSLILPAIILLLTAKLPLFAGGMMLFIFGIGHGIPAIPLCMITSEFRGKLGESYAKAGKWLTWSFGIVIIIIGLLMVLRPFGILLW